MITLVTASTGSFVARLQRWLGKAGYNVKVSGSYAGETQTAVKIFQARHNLYPDGICGPLTWSKLLAVLATRRPPVVTPSGPAG